MGTDFMNSNSIRCKRVVRAGAAILFGFCALLPFHPGAVAQAQPQAEPEQPAPPSPQVPAAELPSNGPAPAPAAPAAESGALSADELNQYSIEAGLAAPEAAPVPSLSVYGFADFSVHAQSERSLPTELAGNSPNFFVGNLNVYLRGDLTRGWKSLAEVRFTYLPNGRITRELTRESTAASDYAEFYAPIRLGGLSIQRAWLEYTAHPLLTVRAGQWLTPIGVWNVDHGTPTIIPAVRPYIIGAGMFPQSQTGFEVYGSQFFGDTTLGYHVTLSSGRGNVSDYADMDKNKALGARAFATFNQVGTLTLGGSLYFGRSTDADIHLNAGAPMPFAQDILSQYDEFVYAFDLLWKYSGFHLQSEFIHQSIAYTDAGRPPPGIPIYPGTLMPDDQVWGLYVLLAYELPWLPLMPFVLFDYSDLGSMPFLTGVLDMQDVYGFGLNYRPVETVTIKGQYNQGKIHPLAGEPAGNLRIFRLTAAWSF